MYVCIYSRYLKSYMDIVVHICRLLDEMFFVYLFVCMYVHSYVYVFMYVSNAKASQDGAC